MKSLPLLLLVAALALAQPNLVTRGAQLYVNTCATGYCHGQRGAAGGAPRLAGRGFDAQYIRRIVTEGHGEMPAFGNKLDAADLRRRRLRWRLERSSSQSALAGRGGGRAVSEPASRLLPPGAAKGRALFFDATRGFERCSTCHQLDGNGLAITDPIAKVPASVAALRALTTPHVRTATAGSESFPTVVVKNSRTEAIIYDLTAPPPVRRTFEGGVVKFADGSSWRHAAVIQSYNDADLELVLAFLQAVVKP